MVDTVVTGTETSQTTQNTQQTSVETKPETAVAPQTETVLTKKAEEVKSWVADDWRDRLANGDAKELNRLKRFPDIGSVYKSFRELESKLSSGQLKTPLPETATEEQLAQYRKEHGIPEKATDYTLNLKDTEITDADEPIISHFLEAAHQENLPPKAVNTLVDALLQARDTSRAVLIEEQKVMRVQAEEELRSEWGGNYIANVVAVNNLLSQAPNGLGAALMTAQLPDGTILGNNPAAIKWLANVALELNPAITIAPGVSGNQLQTVEQELATLDAEMRKNINAWHKNIPAKARHRELLDAQVKLKARGY